MRARRQVLGGGRWNANIIMTRPRVPLLSAKLRPPELRRNYVPRADLQKRLARLPDYKVAVIKGAPGSGKSTLLAAHLQEYPSVQARWVSLDAGDNDMRTLWSYVLEALSPDLGSRADELRRLLDSTLQAGDVDSVLTELVNELQPETDLYLVLDDAHHLTERWVIDSLQFFLRYSSPRVHVILLTRDEPPLYLGEWRMGGQLFELDNDDLKVSGDEARRFLTYTLGLHTDDAVIDRLTSMAEGWIGGLQLLGVAVRQRGRDIAVTESQAGAAFASLGGPLVEYLSGEILDSLTDDEQHFLLSTSILTYLYEDVCRAVTGLEAAGVLLRGMAANNLFIVTVDEGLGLYRYHHLFQEFLQQRLRRLPAEERRQWHRRAAEYYRATDMDRGAVASDRLDAAEESVRHYLAAGVYDSALEVIAGVPSGAQSWRLLQRMPLSTLAGKPDFIYQRLFSHMADQQPDRCGEIIDRFRGTFAEPVSNSLFELFGMLLGHRPGDVQPEHLTSEHLRRLTLGDATKAILYSLLAMVLTLGQREQEALTCLHEADRIVGRVENPYIRYYCMQFKGQLREHMGDLLQCEAIYRDMFRLVERHKFLAPLLVTAHIGIVGILLKGGRLDEARTHLDEVGPRIRGQTAAANPELEAAYLYNTLEFYLLKGDRAEAATIARRLLDLDLLSVPLYRATMLRYLLHLDIADDADLARFQFEQIEAPNWHDHLLHIRLLSRAGRFDEAISVVEEGLRGMRKQQAKLPLVETLLAKADVLARAGRPEQDARNAVREAIHYAHENRLLAPFLLVDESVLGVIRTLRDDVDAELDPSETAFVDGLLSRRDVEEGGAGEHNPLTEREREVLHVLAEGATNRQIAERLHISVATVKTHIVNVYSKLGVSNRVEAVERARERGIIR